MRRYAEQGFCHLTHTLLIEVFEVLGGQHHCRLLLANSLEGVSDILDCCGIVEPDVELVQCGDGVSGCQKFIRHVGQDIEEHGVAHIGGGIEHTLDTEDKESTGCDVGVSIEELGVCTFAHGVQTQ